MTQNKKYDLNERQIAKYANKMSLIDAIDNLDTIHQTKKEFNKKILLNVNNFGDKSHKEKYAAFYLDMNEALLVADDIITGRFASTHYPNAKQPGLYQQYGGGQVSRVLNIGFKDGKYLVQISLHKPNKTRTGAILPGEKIDAHSIQIPAYDMRKFMMAMKTHIGAKLVMMLSAPASSSTTPQDTSSDASNNASTNTSSVNTPPAQTEKEDDPFGGNFDDFFL